MSEEEREAEKAQDQTRHVAKSGRKTTATQPKKKTEAEKRERKRAWHKACNGALSEEEQEAKRAKGRAYYRACRATPLSEEAKKKRNDMSLFNENCLSQTIRIILVIITLLLY